MPNRFNYWCRFLLVLSCSSLSLPAANPHPLLGKPAPAFRVKGIYQETYSLDMFKGHILVMQFGASW